MVKPSLTTVIRRLGNRPHFHNPAPSMKKNGLLLGHKVGRLDDKPASTELTKRIVGLDDDIFAPTVAQRGGGYGPLPLDPITSRPWSPLEETWSGRFSLQCFFHDAGLAARASSGTPGRPEGIDVLPDDERQHFRELLTAALNRVSALENTVTEQFADLTLCRAQIADLCNMRNQQAAELQAAQNESERLTESVAALHEAAIERESEIATAMHKLMLSDNDRLALRAQLDNATSYSTELSQRLLEVNMLLNDKETAVASNQEQFDRLNEAFTETQVEKRELAALIEELKHRHRHELDDQRARFKGLLDRIKIVVAKRDQEIKGLENARANLAARCDGLVKSVGALESAQQQLQAQIDSRTTFIGLLESQLRAERETAKRQIDELNAELERVRSEHAVAERALEEICKDIALLLPELAVRRSRIGKPRLEIATSHMKAA